MDCLVGDGSLGDDVEPFLSPDDADRRDRIFKGIINLIDGLSASPPLPLPSPLLSSFPLPLFRKDPNPIGT